MRHGGSLSWAQIRTVTRLLSGGLPASHAASMIDRDAENTIIKGRNYNVCQFSPLISILIEYLPMAKSTGEERIRLGK